MLPKLNFERATFKSARIGFSH
jgi:hypothetical protein